MPDLPLLLAIAVGAGLGTVAYARLSARLTILEAWRTRHDPPDAVAARVYPATAQAAWDAPADYAEQEHEGGTDG